jgi:hypothetical protein
VTLKQNLVSLLPPAALLSVYNRAIQLQLVLGGAHKLGQPLTAVSECWNESSLVRLTHLQDSLVTHTCHVPDCVTWPGVTAQSLSQICSREAV